MADSHRIRIEYCVPWGARPNAAGLAARLLEDYEHDLAALEIVPGDNGIFDVHVDGRLVFTKSMIGRYPDPDDVLPLVPAHLGS